MSKLFQTFLYIKRLNESNKFWTETQKFFCHYFQMNATFGRRQNRDKEVRPKNSSFQCLHLIVSAKVSMPEFHSEWLREECHCNQSSGETRMILFYLGAWWSPEQTDNPKLGLIWNNITCPQTLSLLVSWLPVKQDNTAPASIFQRFHHFRYVGETRITRHTK